MAATAQIINLCSSPSATQTKGHAHRLPTVSASRALQDLQSHGPDAVSTGLQPLDFLVAGKASGQGGFERGKVGELWGPVGAGKTTILMQAAAREVMRGHMVTWLDAATPLSGPRLRSMLQRRADTASDGSLNSSELEACMSRFSYRAVPTLSHLLALILHPRDGFVREGTSLLIIDGLNSLIDNDYPRILFASGNKTEQQKWQAGRRYTVLGALVAGLNKLAVIHNLAVIVTTGCASRMRTDSGLGSALIPGVGGAEWDAGVWTRMVVLRDYAGRFAGLQKCGGRSLISREEIGEVGKMVGFDISADGELVELRGRGAQVIPTAVKRSPVKPRKRTFDEVADSDGEVDEYGWAEMDDDALAAEANIDEPTDAGTATV
ncbi:hypothetical protein BAUCODRAFT_36929 [Baudoinia panamericana UAMH 10762]|uniref:Uncharacterized protein n=1 Tax=Baudoinia panamericana (strain UAMH 10762) TaxID=717646 RepID=M2LGN3_BAUPA|nr:uncharacterized protein BAUCODRAFT_36929 [Baudoinia panamericana UAMH 10762]EMC93257.1 hypothetical protein BAUCODRAFT_36929 [Baudoinia panamericana UAMH 10762]